MVKLLLIFIILALGIYFSSNYHKGSLELKRKTYIFIITLLLILQSGLRKWDVGFHSDTQQYYYIFEDVKNTPWNLIISNFTIQFGKDPFYIIFQKTFQIFFESYQFYLLFVAIIIMSAIGNFILKNTTKIRHGIISFVVYMGYFYGFFSLTGTRQTLATAFLLWSFEFIKTRKLLLFILFAFVAGLFHISALVFLPFYFIANFKKPKLSISLAVLGFPVIFYFKNVLTIFLVSTASMEDRFWLYTEQYERGGSIVLTLINVLLGLLSLLIIKRVIRINPESYRFYNMFALSLIFYPLQWVNPSAGRISQYFAIVMLVWIPFLLDALAGNNLKARRLIYVITIILFVGLTMFTFKYGNQYKFFWQ